MRYWAALAVLVLALTGCSRVVTGMPRPDGHPPGIALSPDGYGIVAGFADAPVQLEVFTEPQCDHCAHFQASYGEDIRAQIQTGRLAVTYRLLTFFDDGDTGYSQAAANALFVTVVPDTSASTFQGFVENLWANQSLAGGHYTDDDFADLARKAGVAAALVEQIAAGDDAVDATEMNDHNMTALVDANPEAPGTPTVYDLSGGNVVDISDPDWLNALMRAS